MRRSRSCRSRILQVEAQLHDLLCKPAPAVDEQLLAEVIEIWTGIPASKVAAQESARLRDMENRLKSHVIGQDEAVDAVCAVHSPQAVRVSAPSASRHPSCLSARPASARPSWSRQLARRCCSAIRERHDRAS